MKSWELELCGSSDAVITHCEPWVQHAVLENMKSCAILRCQREIMFSEHKFVEIGDLFLNPLLSTIQVNDLYRDSI